MPEPLTLKISGLDEINERLTELGNGKLALSMLRTGSRAAGKVLVLAQQDTVPVERGDLRDSIGVQYTAKSGTPLTLVGPDKKLNFIGRFHEFGTKFMAGSHWMQRAFDMSCKDALDRFIAVVKRQLDRQVYKDLMAAIEEGLSESVEE